MNTNVVTLGKTAVGIVFAAPGCQFLLAVTWLTASKISCKVLVPIY